MKIFKAFVIFLFSSLIFTSCGPSEKEIVRYNDEIVGHQHAVIIAETELVNVISSNDTSIIPLALSDFVYQIETSLKSVKEIPEVDEEFSLKEAAISMFNSYFSIAINQYPEIIELNSLSDEEFSDEKKRRFELLSTQIDEILNQKNMEFFETQQNLSKKHNIAFKIFTNGK